MEQAMFIIAFLAVSFVVAVAFSAGMAQLDYLDQSSLPALEGGLADSGPVDVMSFTPGTDVAQVTTITLSGTPNNSAAYTVTVNGIPVTYTTDASATLAELYAGLLAALQAVPWLEGVIAFTGNGSTIITATAVTPGVPFTLTEAADPGNNMAVATPTPNVIASRIPFGRAVALLTAPKVIGLPSGTGFNFYGFALNRAISKPFSASFSDEPKWRAGDAVPVLRKGRIYVIPETSGAITSPVYVRHTQGSSSALTPGRVRPTDDSGKVDSIAAIKWLDAPVAGALTRVEINLP